MCGKPVIFARCNATGAPITLDAEPAPNGNIAIIEEPPKQRPLVHVFRGDLFESMLPEGPRYVEHSTTCPKIERREPRKK